MILGVGIDILDLFRLFPGNLREGDPFIRRVFTPGEIAGAGRSSDPAAYYALLFSGKEAVFKAIKTSPDGIKGTDIEILNDPSGFPCCTLQGTLRQRAEARGGTRVHISLAREGNTVLAFAVLEGNLSPGSQASTE